MTFKYETAVEPGDVGFITKIDAASSRVDTLDV
jgi:hypothetical protein